MGNQLGLEELTDAHMEAHKGGTPPSVSYSKDSALQLLTNVQNNTLGALTTAEYALQTGLQKLNRSDLYQQGDDLLKSISNGNTKDYNQAQQYINLIFRKINALSLI